MFRGCLLLIAMLIMILVLPACDDNDTTPPETAPTTSPTMPTSSPTPTVSTPTPDENGAMGELELATGERWKFLFYEENGTEFGSNEYEVVSEGTGEYTIESHLNLKSSSTCKPTTADTTYTLDRDARPVAYNLSASIGSG